jgi:hypothetical protein
MRTGSRDSIVLFMAVPKAPEEPSICIRAGEKLARNVV